MPWEGRWGWVGRGKEVVSYLVVDKTRIHTHTHSPLQGVHLGTTILKKRNRALHFIGIAFSQSWLPSSKDV